MELSINTDYAGVDVGDIEHYLKNISDSGFKTIQWLQHWEHDFIYTKPEIEHISKILQKYKLLLYDIHGPVGYEKNWFSNIEYQRLAGVELVKNRIEMCKALGGSVVVMHVPKLDSRIDTQWIQVRKSLNELQETSAKNNVRIALENMEYESFNGIKELFSEYNSDFIGLCYDSGHGNICGDGLDQLDLVKERLISVHLHDNNGLEDQHMPIFTGTVDWEKLAQIIAESPYGKFLTFEIMMEHSGANDEKLFLESAYKDGMKLLKMVQSYAENKLPANV
ncbi:MAG: sugar phosphate isomerase/epimerase [Candidatus Saccharibacteria bacterium]|nr:sugar phosphate isomerase/epimerase [Candidatus Saccharibacteria bacterium]